MVLLRTLLLLGLTSLVSSAQPDRTLRVRVIDAVSKGPISSAVLEVRGVVPTTIPIDQDGVAIVPLPKTGGLGLRAMASGHVQTHVNWGSVMLLDPPPSDGAVLPMPRGVEVGGSVVDELGRPVSGATIDLNMLSADQRPVGPGQSYQQTAGFKIQTDAAGHWSTDQAPERFQLCFINVSHPGFCPIQQQVKPSADALRSKQVKATLVKGLPLTGRVVSADRKPIAGATITFNPNSSPEVSVQSVGDGTFFFAQLPEGPCNLLVRKTGCAPTLRTATVGKDAKPVEAVAGLSHTLRVRVTDPHGEPIVANLSIYGVGGITHGPVWTQHTDADGRASIDAGDEPITVSVGAPGFAAVGPVALEAGAENALTMRQRLSVAGFVLDAQTGKPIEKGRVLASHSELAPAWGNEQAIHDGQYCRSYVGDVKRLQLRFEAPGYEPFESKVFDGSEGDVRYDVKLKCIGMPLTGRVIAADGSPVPGANVVILQPDRSLHIDMLNLRAESGSHPRTDTADDGKFEFDEVDGGYRVIAFANVGIAEVDRETFSRERTIKLQPWGKVEGELRVNDKTGAEQFLIVRPMQWDNISFEVFARTDKAGKFKIDRLPPGETLIARGSTVNSLKVASSGEQKIVDVPAGATASLSLGGNGRKVIGRLALPPEFTPDANWAATDASLTSPHADGDEPTCFANFNVERDGSFQIDDVELGEYTLRIRVTEKPKAGLGLSELTFLGSVETQLSIAASDRSSGTTVDVGTIKLDVAYPPAKK